MNKKGEANTIVIGVVAALIGFGHYMHVNHGWGQQPTIDTCDTCPKHGAMTDEQKHDQ